MESTEAGWARTLFSEAMEAAAYWTIIKPLLTPPLVVRKRVRPLERAALTMRSMRRSEMLASSAQAMPRKSKGRAMGSPWKLPPEITASSSQNSRGLSVTALSSMSTLLLMNSRASRTAPWTWGMHRRA